MIDHQFVRERPVIKKMRHEWHCFPFYATLPDQDGGHFSGAGDTEAEALQSLARNTNRAVLYESFCARSLDEL